jgi:hypothetical protein
MFGALVKALGVVGPKVFAMGWTGRAAPYWNEF